MAIVKTEYNGIVRDTNSSALLNNDIVAYQTFKEQRRKSLQVDQVAQEVDNLKSELSEIKQLLMQVVGREKE